MTKIKRDLPNNQYRALVLANVPSATNVFATMADLASAASSSTSILKHTVKYGEAIAIGQAVYVSSADGTNMIVSKADNSTEGTSSKTMGLAVVSGAANFQGEVITEGLLAGLNTIGATIGDPVWLGSAGNLLYGLANKPVAPIHMVFIGIVTRVNANNGEIFVKVQNGYELHELHDVSLPTYINNGVLYRDTATNLWKHDTIQTLLGQASTTQNGYLSSADFITFSNKMNALTGGITDQVTKWTGAGTIGNSIITDTGTLVGVGITSPSAKLHINNTTTSNSILVEDDTNPDGTPFIVDNAGNVGIGNLTPGGIGKLVVTGTGASGLLLDYDTASTTSSTRLVMRSSTANKDTTIFNAAGGIRFAFAGTAGVTSGSTKFVMSENGQMLFNSISPTISPVAPITAYATAVTNSAEEIARFSVYSLASPGTLLGSTLSLRNGTTTDDEFLPMVRGSQATTSTLTALQIDALVATAQDTAGNTNPALVIRTGNTSAASLNNRPLLDIRNGSASAVYIKPGPLIGINNTNPQAALDITGPGGFRVTDSGLQNQHISMLSDSVLGQNLITSRHDPVLGADFIINSTSDGIDTNSNKLFRLQSYSVDAIVIDSAQRVGIGNSSPTARLHVNNTTTALSLLVEDDANPDPYPFVVDKDGSVGVGMLAPLAKLHVFTGSELPALLIEDTVSPDPSPFVISSTGSVGIGTTTPSTKFHISSATSGAFRLVDTTQGANKYLKSDANGVGTWSALSVADTGLTITTTGTSGAATLVGNTLNIPQYSGGASQTLSQTLALGNTTGANNILLSDATTGYTQSIKAAGNLGDGNLGFQKIGSYFYPMLWMKDGSNSNFLRVDDLSIKSSVNVLTGSVSTYNSEITQSATNVSIATTDNNLSKSTEIYTSSEDILIKGTTGFGGAKYDLNYSANFTDRSLVDKAYVDAAVGGGGATGFNFGQAYAASTMTFLM